ncbi:MAG: PIN domain-containing protein [Bacteroidales bacterium]|nr:PIN domain-containing protein [Bacteroidales bacterium]
MKDNCFLDTNVLIYLFSKEIEKQNTIISLLNEDKTFVISHHIIMEFCNVLKKKFHCNKENILIAINDFKRNFEIKPKDDIIILKALEISDKYKYSFFDSIVISNALTANCNILYSEDMQHLQKINKKLTILNPFKL